MNRLNYITLAPLEHHDKSPHLIKRKWSFKDSQLVQWNYRTTIHFCTLLLCIPYNLFLYSQKTLITISTPPFSFLVFDSLPLSGKTIRPAGFASAGYALEYIQGYGFEQSWVSIRERTYPRDYFWGLGVTPVLRVTGNNDHVLWDKTNKQKYNRECIMPLPSPIWFSWFFSVISTLSSSRSTSTHFAFFPIYT